MMDSEVKIKIREIVLIIVLNVVLASLITYGIVSETSYKIGHKQGYDERSREVQPQLNMLSELHIFVTDCSYYGATLHQYNGYGFVCNETHLGGEWSSWSMMYDGVHTYSGQYVD